MPVHGSNNLTSTKGASAGSGPARGDSGPSSSTPALGRPDPKTPCVQNGSNHVSMSAQIFKVVTNSSQVNREHESDALKSHVFGVYAIFGVPATYAAETAIIFCDDGSDCSLITERGLEKLNGKVLSCGWMDMTTREPKMAQHPRNRKEKTIFSIATSFFTHHLCGHPVNCGYHRYHITKF